MKKLIGIILAVCMLGTIAFATDAAVSPITGTATEVEPNADAGITGYSIAVRYEGLASTAQATMLAYDVTSVANATEKTPFDAKTTPIVGIDQTPANGVFEIALGDTFMNDVAAGASRKIVVKVGGTDVNVPMSWLVTFTKAAVTPGPGEGGEEGGDDEMVEVILAVCGDVNGNGVADANDASLILTATVGGSKTVGGKYAIGADITEMVPASQVTPEA